MEQSLYIDFPEVSIPVQGMESISIPNMYTIKQYYDNQKIEHIKEHLYAQLQKLPEKESWKGKRLAVTVGSRGIPDLDVMVRTICDVCKEWGAKPFIVPSMGSHGGATAQGQVEMIAGYHITEESMGVPICSSMEVVQYGELEDGTPLYCDKYAWESDGIIVFNKVKPHTDFRGKHESGIAKMIAIGLAKHKGASMFHMKGFERFAELIPEITGIFIKKAPVAFGIGVVQNAYDEICNIDVADKEHMVELDAKLLEIAKEKMPAFKFKDCDVLIVDQIGKNISGNGHDPNVVGRNNSGNFPGILNLQRLFIRGLTEETHHNGCGINLCDISTRRCLRGIDWRSTWINVITAAKLDGGRIPMYANTDREALLLSIRTCTNIDFNQAKVARIKNTLCMSEIQVSEALYETIKDREDIEVVSGPQKITFDEEGFMADDIWSFED